MSAVGKPPITRSQLPASLIERQHSMGRILDPSS